MHTRTQIPHTLALTHAIISPPTIRTPTAQLAQFVSWGRGKLHTHTHTHTRTYTRFHSRNCIGTNHVIIINANFITKGATGWHMWAGVTGLPSSATAAPASSTSADALTKNQTKKRKKKRAQAQPQQQQQPDVREQGTALFYVCMVCIYLYMCNYHIAVAY